MSKIYFATKAYNAEKTLRRCIESVLNQTKYGEDIVYYICDNGSTDNTREIINDYASSDSRIKIFYNEKNQVYGDFSKDFENLKHNISEDDYFCALDSDDEYELDFLEKMIPFMQKNELDIAACGYNFIDAKTNEVMNTRTVEKEFVVNDEKTFAEKFHLYHQFMRPVWAKLFSGRVTKYSIVRENLPEEWKKSLYGIDTYITFSMLKKAERIGFLPNVLHKYYIYEKSVSHQYNSKQSESDILLFKDSIEFLSRFGEISSENLRFVYGVYAYAIYDTIKNLVGSKLSVEEKFKEYIKIFSRPETHIALSIKNDAIENVKYELFKMLLSFVTELNSDFDKVLQLMERFSPDCSVVIDEETIKLFARNDEMMLRLFRNDRDMLADYILTLIEKSDPLTRVYNFTKMLTKLAPEGSLAANINDNKFIKFYSAVYAELWNKQNTAALEKMTEILFSGNELNCAEDFLNLYVTLAALENHVDAFLFGNIQKAYLFIDEKRFDEAKQIVNDLVEMGTGESEDVVEIQRLLEK